METPTLFAAIALGAVSFLSPCVLPLVPGYLSTITGLSLPEMESTNRRTVLLPALLFCTSFTLIFTVLGMTATGIGHALDTHGRTLDIVSGTLMALFGIAALRRWRRSYPAVLDATSGSCAPHCSSRPIRRPPGQRIGGSETSAPPSVPPRMLRASAQTSTILRAYAHAGIRERQ